MNFGIDRCMMVLGSVIYDYREYNQLSTVSQYSTTSTSQCFFISWLELYILLSI